MLFTISAIDEKIPKCIEEPTDQTEWESHFGIKRIGKICLIFSPIYIEEKKTRKNTSFPWVFECEKNDHSLGS